MILLVLKVLLPDRDHGVRQHEPDRNRCKPSPRLGGVARFWAVVLELVAPSADFLGLSDLRGC